MIDNTGTRAWWRDRTLGTRREIGSPARRLAIFDTGAGEPIVFVHGLLANANLWRLVVPRLSEAHRCVTLDLPFGAHALPVPDADLRLSGLAALVIEAIEGLGLGAVTLVGNDTGGAVCQLVATTRPDLLARLVLTSCDAYDNLPPAMFGYLKPAARVPAAIGLGFTALRVRALRRLPLAYGWLSNRPLPQHVGDSYVLPAVMSREIRADLCRVLRGLDKRESLAAARRFGEFDRPVLIAWSERDRFFPRSHAEQLAGDFPDARIVWIPDARTFSPEDQPDRLAAAVADFVGQTPRVTLETR
jgi:pimeloyl-ACP methyl ester carboxylesterase